MCRSGTSLSVCLRRSRCSMRDIIPFKLIIILRSVYLYRAELSEAQNNSTSCGAATDSLYIRIRKGGPRCFPSMKIMQTLLHQQSCSKLQSRALVTCDSPGRIKNANTGAISVVEATLSMGILAISYSGSRFRLLKRSLLTGPGATAFTLIPSRAYSFAATLVVPRTPCFEAV